MRDCPVCGDPLLADEPWRLREGTPPVGEAEPGDYAHKRCVDTDTNTDHYE